MVNTCSSIYVSEGNKVHKVSLKNETESKMVDSILKNQHWSTGFTNFIFALKNCPFYQFPTYMNSLIKSRKQNITSLSSVNKFLFETGL